MTDEVHARFVKRHDCSYRACVALCDPATWITHAAFDGAHPEPPVLDWYPGDAEDR